MGTLILPDWNYPGFRTHMTDAERWTAEHGFARGTEYVNSSGEKLAELPDGSAVVLGQSCSRMMSSGLRLRRYGSPRRASTRGACPVR